MDWASIVSPILVTLVTAFGGFITYIGAYALKSLKKRNQMEELKKCIFITNDVVKDSVAEVSQTFVSKLDKDEWTEEAKTKAFDLAKVSALESLGQANKAVIEKNLGDFDSWLKSKIEGEVIHQNLNKDKQPPKKKKSKDLDKEE